MRQALLAPLPPEALKPHPTRTYLTTINAIYVTERFNDVFGLDGWKTDVKVVKDDGEWVVVFVQLTAKTENGVIERCAFGGNDNADIGDRYKGAMTDAITKIGSMLGIGVAVWMNQAPQASSPRPSQTKTEDRDVPTRSNTAPPQSEPTEWLNVLNKNGDYTTLGLEYAERVYAKEMTVQDIRKLFKLSRASAEALTTWRPASGKPMPSQPAPSIMDDVDDDLPF